MLSAGETTRDKDTVAETDAVRATDCVSESDIVTVRVEVAEPEILPDGNLDELTLSLHVVESVELKV